MRYTIAYFFAVLIAVTAGQADAAVGFQHFSINDPQGPPIEVGVWYPTDADAEAGGGRERSTDGRPRRAG